VHERLVKIECGEEEFARANGKIWWTYVYGFLYLIGHCLTLFLWLFDMLKFEGAFFWSVIFGVPHALNLILLALHISHVIRLFDARFLKFRRDVSSGRFDDHSVLWDTLHECRNVASKLSEDLRYILGIFSCSLLLSIALQGAAVFIFKGAMFSLVYMLLNAFVLLFVMFECQTLTSEFQEFREELIHMPVDSVMGDIGGPIRMGFMLALQRDCALPSLKAFSFSLSIDNFYNAVLITLTSAASLLWVIFANL